MASVEIFAGKHNCSGFQDGGQRRARFSYPFGLAVNPKRKTIVVADCGNSAIREIDRTGCVTTIAGLNFDFEDESVNSGNRTFVRGEFNSPMGVTVDRTGKNIYIADTSNHIIQRLNLETKQIEILAGSMGEGSLDNGKLDEAKFKNPTGLCWYNDDILVCDTGNNVIRRVKLGEKIVETFAGSGSPACEDGDCLEASFHGPQAIAVDASSTTAIIYVSDSKNNKIRKIYKGAVSTFADDHTWKIPRGILVDSRGHLHVCDSGNNTIVNVNKSGTVETVKGSSRSICSFLLNDNEPLKCKEAKFSWPRELVQDPNDKNYYFVSDSFHETIRRLSYRTSIWSMRQHSFFSRETKVFIEFMLRVATRLNPPMKRYWLRSASKAKRSLLPVLPRELWMEVLSFTDPHDRRQKPNVSTSWTSYAKEHLSITDS